MVYEEEIFSTEKEADEYIERYLQNYHPAGYGTWARKTNLPDGKVKVNISRGSSCD